MPPDTHATRSPVRTVEVRPPSERDEESAVFLFAVFVLLCVIYIVAFEVYDGGAKQRADRGVLPFQVLFADLTPVDQRMFRQMREGFDEALVEHDRGGDWPAVDKLAADGVPPFALGALDQSELRWRLLRDALGTSYVGVPTASGAYPAYLVRIVAPDPQAIERLGPQTALDEEHRALPDGTLLHVTYWRRDRAPTEQQAAGRDPARDGWSQIRLKSLFEEEGKK